nr:MAG TPA: hypothetical protein [Caudoviricetes sp.]
MSSSRPGRKQSFHHQRGPYPVQTLPGGGG